MVVLGITGRIASGKSTVSRYIKKIKKNTLILDVDKVAKNIYSKNPEILNELRKIFGDEVFNSDGDLIYKSLAEKVFSSKTELEKLNRLMFPLIRSEVKNILNENRDKNYIIIEAAILFDCKLDLMCDYIILVDNSEERREIFLKNKNFLDDDIELRIEGQYIKINRKKVNFIINNNNSKESLLKKVEKIFKNI
ncbi:MAG: dephospho-CoA kinase [Candidatus Hydromicrobium americanum]|nr:MAG: dephospho-CoA kinase [Candidatus Hydromicrobium americanum]